MQNDKKVFLAQKRLAVVGVSRTRGFSNAAFRELGKKGYQVYPVNRHAAVEGTTCYRSLDELPQPVGGVLAVVPPRRLRKWWRTARDWASGGYGCSGGQNPRRLSACAMKLEYQRSTAPAS